MSASFNDRWVALDGGHYLAFSKKADYEEPQVNVEEMLQDAFEQGFDVTPTSELNELTINELTMLVYPEGDVC